MPSYADKNDRLAHRVLGKWRQTAACEIDDIGAWRDVADSRAWPDSPSDFFGQTAYLSGWIGANHPNLDPKPLIDLYEAVATWHERHSAALLPDQPALLLFLDQAIILLNAVEMAIQRRSIRDADAEAASPIPPGAAEQGQLRRVAREILDLLDATTPTGERLPRAASNEMQEALTRLAVASATEPIDGHAQPGLNLVFEALRHSRGRWTELWVELQSQGCGPPSVSSQALHDDSESVDKLRKGLELIATTGKSRAVEQAKSSTPNETEAAPGKGHKQGDLDGEGLRSSSHVSGKAVPLVGDEALATINRMLENVPYWTWKHARTWLDKKGVRTYNRTEWRKAFGSDPPRKTGNVALVAQHDLMEAIRTELDIQNKAFDALNQVEEAQRRRQS